MKEKYQFIKGFPEWIGLGFYRIKKTNAMSLIYDWSLCFGFWAIRKWHNTKNIERDIENYNKLY